ncbi:hypothetical protein ACQEVF_45050 [Nonomuraea polychroma]|uniref:hypothetical protein n=1 Tax=Nonomuraea polychroma TaxID=46176 RepID=UPI003D915A09
MPGGDADLAVVPIVEGQLLVGLAPGVGAGAGKRLAVAAGDVRRSRRFRLARRRITIQQPVVTDADKSYCRRIASAARRQTG